MSPRENPDRLERRVPYVDQDPTGSTCPSFLIPRDFTAPNPKTVTGSPK